MFGQRASSLQGSLEPGLRDFIVLTDIDGLEPAHLRDQTLPVCGPDSYRHRRERREPLLHQSDAIGHAFGNDDVVGLTQQAVLIEQHRIIYEPGDIRTLMFIVNRQLLVLSLFPVYVRSPRSLAADHEHHAATTPVWKDDSFFKKRIQSILTGRAKSSCGGKLPFAEAMLAGSQGCNDTGLIVGKTDQQVVDGLIADGVFFFQPGQRLLIFLEPLVIEAGQLGQGIFDPDLKRAIILRLLQAFLREAVTRQRRHPGFPCKKITGLPMAVGHGTGLTGRYRSRLNKLDELPDISTHTAAEAIPALFVEHHMKRATGLALMVRAITLEPLPGFLCDSSGQ